MMRACLVWAPVAGLNDPGADRARDLGLLVFRAAERVAAFGLDLGLVMGSSEGCATPSVAPPQPRPVNRPAGQDPEARLSRPKSPQQRSDQARKPVNSEQDSCSFPAIVLTQKRSILGLSFHLCVPKTYPALSKDRIA